MWVLSPFLSVWRIFVTKLEQDLTAMLEPAVEALGFELLGLELSLIHI